MSDNLRRSHRIIELKNQKQIEKTGNQSKDVNKKSDQLKSDSKRRHLVCEKCPSIGCKEVDKKQNKTKSILKLKTCFDSLSQKWIKVCNNCAKVMTRIKKISDNSSKVWFEEQKRKYHSNCRSFGSSLVQLLNDSSAERLYCPNLRSSGKACACLQRYVIGSDDNLNEKQRRAEDLLDLLRKAKQLSQQKCYSITNPKFGQKIGLGNGHKKSKEFEHFVNINRNHLKNHYHFCEKAIQRVLFYSNNFLHKKLKTEPNSRQRVQPQKGRTVTGKLIDINLLADQFCCGQRCVQLSQTYPQLLSEWRQRSAIGQLEARRVVSEMLTPTQGFRKNCFKFVSLVTGISLQTINKVEQYLTTNGGNREPTEHGLKRFWIITDKKHSKRVSNALNSKPNINSVENSPSLNTYTSSLESQQNHNTIELIVNQINNEISVINSNKRQNISQLNPRSDFIENSEQSLQSLLN